ncbi:DUF1996 domain-containing protein [Serratia liquefaciens]|uniref:DUF1996 domain-containing protein n=1 Tax=Serratia liquefaciens TaxID=614 RepID=UPI00301C7766
MKYTLLKTGLLATLYWGGQAWSAAGFNVTCDYSHTLPDDAILYPQKPGEAMLHDFFGNTKVDAFTTTGSLVTNPQTTCHSSADRSAYWTPSLRRGTDIIKPMLQKTYYWDQDTRVKIHPFPPGLQMLAGDHRGDKPNSHVDYLCSGDGYTQTVPQQCSQKNDNNQYQLNINVHFPFCWDGKNLKPDVAHHNMNVVYPENGVCPASHPVTLPEMHLSVAYELGDNPDVSQVQLSLDPVWEKGQWQEQWGSLYTAHADFINGWKPDGLQFVVDNCMNNNIDCNDRVPLAQGRALADAWIDQQGNVTVSGEKLRLNSGDTLMIKLAIPDNLDSLLGDYPHKKIELHNVGGYPQGEGKGQQWLSMFAANTQWNEHDTPPSTANCSDRFVGFLVVQQWDHPGARFSDFTDYAKEQLAKGEKEMAVCVRNSEKDSELSFYSHESRLSPVLVWR